MIKGTTLLPLLQAYITLLWDQKDPYSDDTGVYTLVAEIDKDLYATEPIGTIRLDPTPPPAHPTGGQWVGSRVLEMGKQTKGIWSPHTDQSVDGHNYFELPKVPEWTRVAIYMSLKDDDHSATLQLERKAVNDSYLSNEGNFPIVIDLLPGNDAHQHLRVKHSTSESFVLLVEEVRALRELAEWEEKANGIGMKFVELPSTDDLKTLLRFRDLNKGIQEPEEYVFYMGRDDQERGWLKPHSHENRSEREITAFWIGKYEVTQCEWAFLMNHPDPVIRGILDKKDSKEASEALDWFCNDHGDGQKPVVGVTYLDALEFVAALNDLAGGEGYHYRLPSEAEWEYAAQAGTSGEWYGEVDDIAWHSGNSWKSDEEPVPELKVGGLRQPNAFGLYDMLGNAWEWTHDVYDRETTAKRWTAAGLNFVADKASEPFSIPFIGTALEFTGVGLAISLSASAYDIGKSVLAQTPNRVLRGGSFSDEYTNVRAAIRLSGEPGLRVELGQRVEGALYLTASVGENFAEEVRKNQRFVLDFGGNKRKIKGWHSSSLKLFGKASTGAALGMVDYALGSYISPILPWANEATKGNNIGLRVVMEGDPR